MPRRMKGIRRPILVLVRSESAPNSGSRKSARMLSSAMIAPEIVSFRRNVSVRILGMTLSYICQNEQMDKKARPTRIVRR